MSSKKMAGLTLLEIMLALAILAITILPIAHFLLAGVRGTRVDQSETEAVNAACDILDDILMNLAFEKVPSISPDTPAQIALNFTDIRFSVETRLVPLPVNFYVPTVPYHEPCPDGIEKFTDLEIKPDNLRGLIQLDLEKLKDLPLHLQADLMDIKLTVKWRRRGTPDSEFERNPIVLYTRKARL